MRTVASEMTNLELTPFYKEVETKSEIKYRNHDFPCVVPVGTKLTIYFSQKNPWCIYFDYDGHLRATRVAKMKDYFYGKFKKMPTEATLERWDSQGGYCETVTGHRTEPDGYGPDGSPSWMLVYGVI